MNILFSVAPWAYGLGPLGQCLCVSKYARQLGHTCRFVVHDTAKKHVVDSGNEVLATEAETEWPATEVHPSYFSEFLELAGLNSVAEFSQRVESSLLLLMRSKPDVIFSAWHLPVQIAAMKLGIPVVNSALYADHPSFIANDDHGSQHPGVVEECLNTVMANYGLPPVDYASDLIFHHSAPVCAVPSWIDASFLTRGIEVQDVATLCYDYGATTDNPSGNGVVYLPGCSDHILDQTCGALIDLGLSPAMTGQAHGQSVSFERLLQRAEVTVAHGGVNTVLMSLQNGTPVVALPLGDGERCHFVKQAEHLGCVFQAEGDEASLHNAIKAALSDESRKALAAVQERIQSANGPAAVVQLFHVLYERQGHPYS